MNLSAANGDVLPVHPQPVKATTTRATVANRLTRMFSNTGKMPSKEPKESREPDPARDSSDSSTESINAPTNGSAAPSRPTSRPSSRAPSRQTSTKGDNEKEKKTKPTNGKDQREGSIVHKRFEMFPDGTHCHHLKSARRQEKLTDLLRDMLGGGSRKKDDHVDDQQLSLMSTWIDQFKTERDKLAADKKGGPNATASLVDKYGKCQEIVGRGAFGIVRISHKVDPKDSRVEQLYAVKEFRRRPQETAKKYQKRLTSEFCISSSLRHPNVIHTLDLLQDAKGDYCEVMEYCAGGDLYTLVLAAGKLEVAEADCFFKQLMRGVEYMHEMGVAHRDLKPENLLLTTHGALKITDFGNGECFRMAWEKEAHMTAGLCGSAPYIAPEEYVEKEFDPRAVDVWATGVIYMAMRTGRHLWRVARKDEDEFYQRYLEGRKHEDGYAPIETLHRARCRNVIYSILDPNPSRRINASQVLKSEWVREIKLCKAGEEGF
ncbi:Pkinase-domain-containing protein [Aspergillus fumigatus]|nr:Pkinase-domain-containing protein [Aspergillus fumigatus]KAH1290307.1 Pkinase-domain-containing protein [Aspergillus fumigatus]KAH1404572.1 Pkinase-domain-containing protein [Aspergillus fumigatus]KAH1431032.1 Pkinase-domain-containing protein [Aspergillus fumigatus]KAH1456897.1 Pkinase-domain-containing protein [Aspergillus fumigatus]